METPAIHRPEQGPLREAGLLSAGLDYYKLTMSRLLYEQDLDDVNVTFTFKNRGEQRLMDYVGVDNLQQRLDMIRDRGWQTEELDFLAGIRNSSYQCPAFSEYYLRQSLGHNQLPPVDVRHDPELDDLAIESSGPAPLVTFWETIIMSEVNEMYFENYVQAQGLDLMAVYDEGDRRLSEKVAVLQDNPDIKFIDFGTRRHFSLRWQRHVVQRLQAECPDNFVGTSNVGLAHTLDIKPVGTFAHEMPMIYAGLADARGEHIRFSHYQFLQDWYKLYGEDLSIALTDTFGSEFFFSDFTPQQAEAWRGVRHDSGDPVAFGEQVIAFYEANAINPLDKTIVFSDGLDLPAIVKLQRHFGDRINVAFGWGTNLTNDLGLPALNVVAKATRVETADGQVAETVKLSDTPGKHCGPDFKVDLYKKIFNGVVAHV